MKALTLYQPWATLVAIGAKRIETRSWKTDYRGPLAIHAGKYMPEGALDLCLTEPFYPCLRGHKMPRGFIVATCELVDVHKIDGTDWMPQLSGWEDEGRFWAATPQEKAFGNYRIGRFMWFLDNIKALSEPVRAKGAMGLWEWDEQEVKG